MHISVCLLNKYTHTNKGKDEHTSERFVRQNISLSLGKGAQAEAEYFILSHNNRTSTHSTPAQ